MRPSSSMGATDSVMVKQGQVVSADAPVLKYSMGGIN